MQYEGHQFDPWPRKIPLATEQLSWRATTTEPACLEPVLHNKRTHDKEKPTHHNEEEWPLLSATTEKSVQQRRSATAKNTQVNQFLKEIYYQKSSGGSFFKKE